MKEQTHFHIPTPCHEDWDNMTPKDKGRFCASCSKQVVDFSLMSDQQVLNYFKNATGKTCGRFANDQLQRPMIETQQQKKKVWWIAAMIPLLLMFGKANAQKKKIIQKKLEPVLVKTTLKTRTLGMIAPEIRPVISMKKILSGTVQDEKGNPIAFANISSADFNKIITSDSDGNFELSVLATQNDSISINASCIGYESTEQKFFIDDDNILITLKQKEINLPEVLVSTNLNENICSLRLGGAYSVTRITRYERADTFVRKVFSNEAFKIFPNPATENSSVKIEIKKVGNYSIQLLDNNSKLILIKDVQILNEKSITEITIPSSLAAGMYYVRLVDEDKKKQYTDKLIVQ